MSNTSEQFSRQLKPPPLSTSQHETHERFGFPPGNRILTGAGLAYGGGLLLGLSVGGRKAGLRFRAENAHRLPINKRGWYLYHQEKNKQVLLESFREGNRMGMRLLPLVVILFGVEETMDTLRLKEYGDDSRKDFLSTTVAGVTAAGCFSTWHQLPMATAARMAKLGLLFGLGVGLAQDALHVLRGQRLAYVEIIRRLFKGNEETQELKR